MHWHEREAAEVVQELKSALRGLSSAEARKRREEYGPNELKEKKRRPPFMMLLDQFRDFMILVLVAASIISGIIGEVSDTVAILVIVILNAIIGFVQEYRAEKAMAALKKMASPSALVLRDDMPSNVAVAEIVPGDVITLEAGRVVPADMRLMEVAQLKIDEAALTGESVPVDKSVDALREEAMSLGDRRNMAYKGTTVAYGRGMGIAVATGMRTELGRIAQMLQEEGEAKTPLQKRLSVFGRKISFAVLVICAIVFGVGIVRGEPALQMLLTAISLAVAAIPEALPAVVTVALALGARKMVRQNALIRKLPAVETLGSVTYICTDKTGTLTLNKMTVEEFYLDGELFKAPRVQVVNPESLRDLNPRTLESFFFTALALSNDAGKDAAGALVGDPTEIALYAAAQERGFEKKALEREFPRVAEVPFDSERKCMTTFHKWPRGQGFKGSSDGLDLSLDPLTPRTLESFQFVSFTKGAVDVLLERADSVLTSHGVMPLDREGLLKVNEKMSADGLRVLCMAMRGWDEIPGDLSADNVERGLVILGLLGIMDPPRDEAKEAVHLCRAAGIKPVMITGDHPLTARTIAKRLGILEGGSGEMMTGKELAGLPHSVFEERVEEVRVYARVAPEQKLKIVRALQKKGHFVAMTGDGVNDAPALKRADIGIAMGVTGTDVAKESADMILLDDNFATIVKAVKEGRKIYDNIRKFVKYLLTTNSGEIWTLFLAPLVGLPLPLLPIHILWINLMTDGLPALALSMEPAEGNVMKRPPRHPKESIFAHGLWIHAIWVGILMAGVALFVQSWSIRAGNVHWQTMVFTVLCFTQLGNVLAIRSERESLFTIGLFSNKSLLGAVAVSFLLQMAVVYIPALNPVFRTQPLSPGELTLTLAASSVIFFTVEIDKARRRLRSGRGPF